MVESEVASDHIGHVAGPGFEASAGQGQGEMAVAIPASSGPLPGALRIETNPLFVTAVLANAVTPSGVTVSYEETSSD